jgi:3-oxoacyl-[acyl-carrier-protein] synthase-3
MSAIRTVISATGSHIPEVRVPNEHFLQHDFRGSDSKTLDKTQADILRQFEAITGIRERRKALDSSGIDPESLDGIIVAHNFGDVRAGSNRSDFVPALAARVKAALGIRNPYAMAFDLVFGCPGWLQGVIVADSMIRAGDARRMMIIGADMLSRVSDPHDRDSLIYADGAGAVIVEGRENVDSGILSRAVRSDTLEHSSMMYMAGSYNPEIFLEAQFLKMEGRKLYKYALNTVAGAMKEALDRAKVDVHDIRKILIHQANGKMDEAILAAFYQLYGSEPPADVMPMTISWLGNSSVATVPTLLDLIVRGELEGHTIASGDLIVFASVGAGMHINAVVYRWP